MDHAARALRKRHVSTLATAVAAVLAGGVAQAQTAVAADAAGTLEIIGPLSPPQQSPQIYRQQAAPSIARTMVMQHRARAGRGRTTMATALSQSLTRHYQAHLNL